MKNRFIPWEKLFPKYFKDLMSKIFQNNFFCEIKWNSAIINSDNLEFLVLNLKPTSYVLRPTSHVLLFSSPPPIPQRRKPLNIGRQMSVFLPGIDILDLNKNPCLLHFAKFMVNRRPEC